MSGAGGRAVVCHQFAPPERLVVETLPQPEPAQGEVAVAVHCAGLNFPDTLIVQGKYQERPQRPFVPGCEAAGTMAAIGPGVTGLAPGQRVIALPLHGAFAETLVVPAERVLPLPAGMDFATAAGFALTYATAYHALSQRARLQAGETLLVLGAAGGVGSAAVELGVAMGARVIAAASSPKKLGFARELGASEGIDYQREDLKDRVRELTNGEGVDVVFDPVGGDLSEQALRATAWDGRFLVIGFASGEIAKIPLNLPLLKGLHIVGVFWGRWAGAFARDSAANFARLAELYAQGAIRPRIGHRFDLDDVAAAMGVLLERRARGKVVLDVRRG